MKKLISILLIVALLAICLCSCQFVPHSKGEQDTTAPQEEETTTNPNAWAPKPNPNGEEGPIELPANGLKPTIGQ